MKMDDWTICLLIKCPLNKHAYIVSYILTRWPNCQPHAPFLYWPSRALPQPRLRLRHPQDHKNACILAISSRRQPEAPGR